MVPLSMTLSDLWPGFKGHDILWSRISDKVTVAQEESIRNIWTGTMFGDLDWSLNASRGFVSIRWASCFYSIEHYEPCVSGNVSTRVTGSIC